MKLKSKKSALLMSFTSLLICFAMLVGSTFAWFTDTATTGVNKIVSGNLKVDIVGETGDTHLDTLNFTKAAGAEDEQLLWEPGCRYLTEGFRIANKGNLALKWKAQVNKDNIVNGKVVDTAKDGVSLLDVIDFYVVTKADDGTETAVAIENFTGKLAANVGKSETYYIKGVMQTTAGNDYQSLTLDGISITVYATQDTVENDSYDNQYDKDAPYETVKVSDEKELRTALFNAPTDGSGVKIVLQDDITLDMYYSALLFAHSNTADKWQHSGGLSAEDAAIEAAKPENNEVPDYSTAYDTLAHYKTAVNGWDTVSSDLAEQAKFGANFPMSATNPVARLVVKAGQDIIIDLNGKTIAKRSDATHGSWSNTDTDIIANYGMLKIVDSVTGGKVVGRGYNSCGGAVLHNYNGAIMVVEKVDIDGNAQGFEAKTGQYVVSNEGGKVVIDGANIYDPQAAGDNAASLLHNVAGTMIVKGNAMLNHPASKNINCKGGEVFVESATIISDKYAIYAKGGTVTVTDSAVEINGTGTMTAEGGTIIHK